MVTSTSIPSAPKQTEPRSRKRRVNPWLLFGVVGVAIVLFATLMGWLGTNSTPVPPVTTAPMPVYIEYGALPGATEDNGVLSCNTSAGDIDTIEVALLGTVVYGELQVHSVMDRVTATVTFNGPTADIERLQSVIVNGKVGGKLTDLVTEAGFGGLAFNVNAQADWSAAGQFQRMELCIRK